jgi:phosphatidate cytidylyltransferase
VTRVLSGAALVLVAIGVVWFANTPVFFAFAFGLTVLATEELLKLAYASRVDLPVTACRFATALVICSSAFAGALEVGLLSAFVAVAAASLGSWRGGPDALTTVAVALFPAFYVALPIAAMVGIRVHGGPPALFLLMLTVMVSDTAQYYSGRAFGRRPLAPLVSPKKTIEGAIGGFVFGGAVFTIIGAWWLPDTPAPFRAMLGVTIVALGIAGDLFESMLKRSAGVKDSSALIPGHGGVLDRIDALLFAAPVYYIVLTYV